MSGTYNKMADKDRTLGQADLAFKRLERNAEKLARCVLRGAVPSNGSRLLDKTDTIEKEKYVVEFASERAEGKVEGKEENAREVAKRMIRKGHSVQEVCEIAELSIEVVQSLIAEFAKESNA